MDAINPRHALRKSIPFIPLETIRQYLPVPSPFIPNPPIHKDGIDLDILPRSFDTPMFWTEEELQELKGTEILPRIGKQKSEQQYTEQLLPLINTHPELFDLTKCDIHAFHTMGSLVLAYSFGNTVSQTNNDSSDNEDDFEEDEGNTQIAMVPLADMLNADPQKNNVPLLTQETSLILGSIISRGIGMGNESDQIN